MGWFSNTPSIADILARFVPVSGDNIQVPAGVTLIILDHAALIAVLTVTATANPVDGQRLIISCGAPVTVMSVAGNGAAVKGGIGTLIANAWARYSYVAASNAWFRTG